MYVRCIFVFLPLYIRVDYRLLYMVSYDQYQRQYLYHADRLKEELEARMKVRVDFVETATGKEKRDFDFKIPIKGLNPAPLKNTGCESMP